MSTGNKIEPIREPNAIDQVVFVLKLNEHMTPNVVAKLQALRKELADLLPMSSDVQVSSVEVGSEGIRIPQTQTVGLELKSEETDHMHKFAPKRPEWILRASEDVIQLNCLNYTKWDEVSEKARDIFNKVLSHLTDTNTNISEIVLQINDVFVYSGTETDYKFDNFFSNESGYFPEHISNAGWIWHNHQGWFEKESGNSTLNVLNVGTRKDEEIAHITTIEHVERVLLGEIMPISKCLEDNFLEKTFTQLHASNKSLIKKILVEKIKEKIGL